MNTLPKITYDPQVYCPNYVDNDLVSDLLHLSIPGLGLNAENELIQDLGHTPVRVEPGHIYMALQNIVAPAIRAALHDLIQRGGPQVLDELDTHFMANQFERCLNADELDNIATSLIQYIHMLNYEVEHQPFEDVPRVRVGRTPVQLLHPSQTDNPVTPDSVTDLADLARFTGAADPADPTDPVGSNDSTSGTADSSTSGTAGDGVGGPIRNLRLI